MQQGTEASINVLFSCCCFCCCFAALFHRLGSTGNGSGSGNVNSKLRIKLASNYAFNKPPIPPTPFAAPPKRKHLHPPPPPVAHFTVTFTVIVELQMVAANCAYATWPAL